MPGTPKAIRGTLYLIPSDFGDGTDTTSLIPESTRTVACNLRYFVVENERSARRFLRRIGFTTDFAEVKMQVLNVNTPPEEVSEMLQAAREGKDVGVLSEAGMPCIADPGALLVHAAHKEQITVSPLTGPSSIFLTIAASGLNGQHFSFTGYLPVNAEERKEALRDLEQQSRMHGNSYFLIETPHRSAIMFEDMLSTFRENTFLCIGCEIGIPSGWSRTASVKEWKKAKPDLKKKLCVFGFQAAVRSVP